MIWELEGSDDRYHQGPRTLDDIVLMRRHGRGEKRMSTGRRGTIAGN